MFDVGTCRRAGAAQGGAAALRRAGRACGRLLADVRHGRVGGGDLAAELASPTSCSWPRRCGRAGERPAWRRSSSRSTGSVTKRLDLMQIHNLLDWRDPSSHPARFKQTGRIRYVGVTHYTASAYDELERVLRSRAARLRPGELLPRGARGRASHPAAGARARHRRAGEPAVLRGRALPARPRQGAAGVGGRDRLRELGAVVIKWVLAIPPPPASFPPRAGPSTCTDKHERRAWARYPTRRCASRSRWRR